MKVDSGIFTNKKEKKIKKQLKKSKVKTSKTTDNNDVFITIYVTVITVLICMIVITSCKQVGIIQEPIIGGILEGPTEMHQLYKELALNIENMDIVDGLEGIEEISELADIIEDFTGEKVCIEYGYDSFKEEGEKYTIETSGRSRRPYEDIYTITSILVTDRETGETIYIQKGETIVGGTPIAPEYDYCMKINYYGFNYNIKTLRYDYEEETTYETIYNYENEETVESDVIEERYDNVNEIFNILYK